MQQVQAQKKENAIVDFKFISLATLLLCWEGIDPANLANDRIKARYSILLLFHSIGLDSLFELNKFTAIALFMVEGSRDSKF